jgi:hypothetical protein
VHALALLLALADSTEGPATRLIYLPGRFADACPGEVEVQEGVTRRLGRSPFAEPADRLVLLALEGDGAGPVRARMELLDARMESLGARVLQGSDECAELVEAAELAISIALAPSLALTPVAVVAPPDEPSPVAPPENGSAAEEGPVEIVPGPAPYMSWMPAGSWLRFGGGIHGSVLLGPAPTIGGHMSVAVRSGAFELELEQKQELPVWDAALLSLKGGSVNALLACGEWTWVGGPSTDALGGVGCASASWGSLWAVGPGVATLVGVGAYAGAGMRLAASWTQPDGSVLRPWAQVEWTLLRPELFFEGGGVAGQNAVVNVHFGLTYEKSWGR